MCNNIIFLDIDGPMVPGTWCLIEDCASLDRKFSPIAVRVLKLICDEFDAKVVLNSSHNTMFDEPVNGTESVRDTFETYGLTKYLLGKTDFPVVPIMNTNQENRLVAVEKWIDDNDFTGNWVIFDDVSLQHENAYTVSFDYGIGTNEYNFAAGIFGYPPVVIL